MYNISHLQVNLGFFLVMNYRIIRITFTVYDGKKTPQRLEEMWILKHHSKAEYINI